jgi:hypothetical protein
MLVLRLRGTIVASPIMVQSIVFQILILKHNYCNNEIAQNSKSEPNSPACVTLKYTNLGDLFFEKLNITNNLVILTNYTCFTYLQNIFS